MPSAYITEWMMREKATLFFAFPSILICVKTKIKPLRKMWFSDFMLIFAIYSDAIYLTFIAAQRLVMMRKHSSTFFLRAVCLVFVTAAIALLAGCGKTRNVPLNVSEMFFGKKLSSVSADSYDADRYFVGTEDGVIYVVNTATNDVDTLLTSFDRIYKVVPDMTAQGLRYWVGTRNMGLLLCSRSADSLVAVARYVLPAAERPERYSAYDVSVCRTGVYVATSHGLLKVAAESKDKPEVGTETLGEVFVRRVGEGHASTLKPMVAADIRPYDANTLLCATDRGLLRVDLRHDKTETFLGKKVTGISLHSGDVMALAGDSLLMVDIKGRRLAGVRLAQPAQGCFYDEANAMNYLVSDGHVQLFRDKEIGKPEAWQQMEVGMSVPMNCHNVVLANPRQRQSLLVGKYSLFRVANHQDVFNSIGEVELACASGNNIYYLVGTRLFRQAVGKDEAVQIKDISGGTGDVRFMQVIGNRLYYVDSANKAYSARLYSSYLLNSLLSFDRLVSPAVRHEVTAMGADGANVYLGIRDGLVNLHRADSCLDSNVFINRFVRGRDRVAFATLNDGVFTGRDNRFQRVAGTERLAFVRDVAFVPSDSSHTTLYILTNHALLRSHADSLTMMCPATGYRRLLAADSKRIYGVADFGIDNLTDSVRLFSDVHFQPEACLVADGKVYAGSGSGVYVFGGTEGKQEAAESGYTVVMFVAKTLFSRTNIVLLVVLVCALVGFVWWYDRHVRRMNTVENLQERLLTRLTELSNVEDLLGEDLRSNIKKWEAEIKTIGDLPPAEAKEYVRELNKDIQKATFKVPTVLSLQIEKQIERLNSKMTVKKCTDRLKESKNARLKGDIAEMANLIAENERWLQEVTDDEEFLKGIAAVFEDMVEVPGVSGEIIGVINSKDAPDAKLHRLYDIIGGDNADKPAEGATKESIVRMFRDYLSSPEIASKTLAYVKTEHLKLKACEQSAAGVASFRGVYEALDADYQNIKDRLTSECPDVSGALTVIPTVNSRRDILQTVLTVHDDVADYYRITKSLAEDNLSADERKEMKAKLKEYETDKKRPGRIACDVERFYVAADKSMDRELFTMIKLTRKKTDGLFLSEIVLMLMMAHTGKKVSSFNDYIDAAKQHIRKLRREIVGEDIAACKAQLEEYAKRNPSSFAPLLLDTYETYNSEAAETSIIEEL